jgi:RNA polymerase sigma factor (sigma-70 family)
MARLGELLATLLRRRTPDGDPLSDAVLLDRFARGRDPAAFELLVWRHGPMVLAACRRVLKDAHSAEDAFQAAFLVLSRKAGSVRGSAAGWLHRVALRVCLRMKRRLPLVSLESDPLASPAADPVEAAERSAILDEEVARLPEFLRVPVVVCYLQGHTTERAAEVLGIPRGTVLSRLATARKRLATRLTARGVGPLVAAATVPELSADTGRTVAEVAVGFAAGKTSHTVPVQLALEVLAMTKRTAAVMVAGAFLLVVGFGTGLGFVAAHGAKPTATTAPTDKPTDKKGQPPAVAPPPAEEQTVRVRLMKMLAQVDDKLGNAGTEDVDGLRQRLRAAEQRQAELLTRVRTDRLSIPAELEDELAKADERVTAARGSVVPRDVLAEAVKLHPKVAGVQQRLSAKEDEWRASKLPKDDAGRKKLDEERVALFKELQATQKEVGPEVEAYLRTPALVDAQKARAAAERKLRVVMEKAEVGRHELDVVIKEVDELRAKVAKLEPQAEELAWLKEKRKRLKQELLELELKELGVGK